MCTYHDEAGHYTTRCAPFKKHFEELPASGHLNQWIDTRHTQFPRPPPVTKRLVGVIQGLISTEKATELRQAINRAVAAVSVYNIGFLGKMKWVDPNDDWSITFTQEDLEGIQTPHTDALVVMIIVDKSAVQRVLVDQGSSVEVMFHSAYKSLSLQPN